MADSRGLEQKNSEQQERLLSGSFLGLLFTQFLTATNDNVFRWLVIGIGKDFVEPSQVGTILMLGTVLFVVPYLGLAAFAGYLADRFPKNQVILGCKIAEILIMALGVAAIFGESLPTLFVAVFLMGAQSAIFGPAKLGSIPEILKPEKVSLANGLFGLTTVGATVIGMAVGNSVKDIAGFRGVENYAWLPAAVLLGIAVVGTLLGLLLQPLPIANPSRKIPWDFPVQTLRDLRTLTSRGPLFRVALGSVFFWSLGALAQLNIDQFAFEGGAINETQKVPLLVCLVFGLGLGAVLAGIWSRGRVELGLLPLGAFGIVISCFLLFLVEGTIFKLQSPPTTPFLWACLFLVGLGFSAGLFDVPINAYMQQRSPREHRGSILAASNFLTFSGVVLIALLFNAMRTDYSPGRLENAIGPVGKTEQQAIDTIVREYSQNWQPSVEQDQIKEYLDANAHVSRKHLLAHLLWEDVAKRSPVETSALVEEERADPGFPQLSRVDYLQAFRKDAELVSQVYTQASGPPFLAANEIFLVCGIGTVPVFLYIVWLIPQATIRFLVWIASGLVYRIRLYGAEHVPEEGGALLVANHVSWIDGILILLATARPVRMVAYAGSYFKNPLMGWVARSWGVILISGGPKSIRKGLDTAREAINQGELVCIFPEGSLSRSGQLQAFRPGTIKVLEGTDAPVIPVYLDELWGSIFSFSEGKFFWKRPKRLPYPISIHFDKPLADTEDMHQIRQGVVELGAKAVQQRTNRTTNLPGDFLRMCKRSRSRMKAADTMPAPNDRTGTQVTGGQLLGRVLAVRRFLRRSLLQPDETNVGVLLPPGIGGVVINMALALDRRVSVNLNYTVTPEVMNGCLKAAGITHVLTSRKFVETLKNKRKTDYTNLAAELVYLEDARDKITSLGNRLVAGLQTYLTPVGLLERWLGLKSQQADDVATIIFTSGSTGTPKGVMLTYANVASNVSAINHMVNLSSDDVVIGILPFFHSMGYTVTIWTAMALDISGVYHNDPTESRKIGPLAQKHDATVLVATPTFLRNYLRRCEKEQFAKLDVVVAGAEKLPIELCDAFEEKFGVRPVEGYGTTELSPLVSVNIPPSRAVDSQNPDLKEGTVGRPIPGVSAKVVDPDTGVDLGPEAPGMLMIKGPNVMKGYYGREDLTAEVIQDGWYRTGDIALIDEEGFIRITGRQSRFSKIGGEMVPHVKIEEILNDAAGMNQEDGLLLAVTAVPDKRKGERLIVLHLELSQSVDELRQALSDAGEPNINIPSTDSFHQVQELPILGTGKVDLKGIKQMALEIFGAPE
ncbi:MAG: MFS transporter [Planctomycetota bacterium]|nr:MFS transporter [Planctomycetota bacterium]